MLDKIKKKFDEINEFIALHTVAFMSSIWCVYLFAVWCMVPFIYGDLSNVVLYISSAVIQLVALPLIMVGQKLQSGASEARADQDHAYIVDMHNEMRQVLIDIKDIVDDVHDVLAYVDGDANTVPSTLKKS